MLRHWIQTTALLCLLVCAPLQAAEPLATRDHALIKTAVAAAGGRPVIVGTSHTGTAATITLTREAAERPDAS